MTLTYVENRKKGGDPGNIPQCPTGQQFEEEHCSTNPCPMWVVWEEWNPCSVTCGNGERTRYRACKGGRPGDRGCESGGDFDQGECRAEIECPRYEHWLTWEKCSASCHGGTRKRERSCLKFAEWQECVPEVKYQNFPITHY